MAGLHQVWIDYLPEQWDPKWIQHLEDQAKAPKPPCLFRAWCRGSGGDPQLKVNTPKRITPPGYFDLSVPRGKAPHKVLTPREFFSMVCNHITHNDGDFLEEVGRPTLFSSWTQSPTWAMDYVSALSVGILYDEKEHASISMIDTSRLGNDAVVYHLPRLGQLFKSIGFPPEVDLEVFDLWDTEILVFGVIADFLHPGSISTLSYEHMSSLGLQRLDGLSQYERSRAEMDVPEGSRALESREVMPLTNDLFSLLLAHVRPCPREGIFPVAWMLALMCTARRSEDLLKETDCVPTDLLKSIADEFSLNPQDIDALIVEDDGTGTTFDDLSQFYRLAKKLRQFLRLRALLHPQVPAIAYL